MTIAASPKATPDSGPATIDAGLDSLVLGLTMAIGDLPSTPPGSFTYLVGLGL